MTSFESAIERPNVAAMPIYRKLDAIYRDLEDNVLRIFGRRDVIFAIDLSYHSALQFIFNGRLIPRGWIEVLIPGDAGTGKSTIAECLLNHYRCGELRLGEAVSVAGLIGGIDRSGDRSIMRWGILPRCDGKLLILDEAHALHPEVLGALTGVRSSGIAEVTKIVQMRTHARVRKVWICNPTGRNANILSYGNGILVVPSVIDRAEDIRRFDLAVIAADGDVPKKLINEASMRECVPHRYTSPLCARLIRWTWSRGPSQVYITSAAVSVARELGDEAAAQYTAEIPLLLDAEAALKLMRMAVAIAARTFSTTPNRQAILVDYPHVWAAKQFLDYVYAKQSCRFRQHSASRLTDVAEIRGRMMRLGRKFLRVLHEHSAVGKGLFEDLFERKQHAHDMYRFLLLNGALEKKGRTTRKTNDFIDLLNQVMTDPDLSEEPLEQGVTVKEEIDVDDGY